MWEIRGNCDGKIRNPIIWKSDKKYSPFFSLTPLFLSEEEERIFLPGHFLLPLRKNHQSTDRTDRRTDLLSFPINNWSRVGEGGKISGEFTLDSVRENEASLFCAAASGKQAGGSGNGKEKRFFKVVGWFLCSS